MKFIRSCLIIILVLLLSSIKQYSIAQATWYKYPGKIDGLRGTDGEWDEFILHYDILFVNNEYHMWYEGMSSDDQGRWKFGFATSSDGIHFEKYPGNPLDFNDINIDWVVEFWTFDVIRKDSMYLMWFTAETKDPFCSFGIGFAWSEDGKTWEAHPEPVLKPGKGASWDNYGVTNPNVIFDGKIYHMWYAGFPNWIPKKISIGYATSADGIHWAKHPSNPVLKHGEPGAWDDHWVAGYSVTINKSLKEMWYFGYNQIKFEIGLATSEDGVRWTKSPENPVLKAGKQGEWDANVLCPRVIKLDSVYRIWYIGELEPGYATTSLTESESWDRENIVTPYRKIRVRVFNRLEFINVDSLSQILPELSGTSLIDAYTKLALAYSLNDDVKSYHYSEKALELAKLEDYPAGRAMAHYSMGNSQYVSNNYTDALVNQLTALRIFDSLGMQLEVGNLLSQIASIHTYAGSHEMACKYHQQALFAFMQLQDTTAIINVLNYLGESYLDAGDTLLARKTFEKVLVLADKFGQTSSAVLALEGLAKSYHGYLLDSSIYFIMEARNIMDLRGFLRMTANSLLLAEIYLGGGPDYNAEAEEYLQESLNLLQRDILDPQNQLRWSCGMAELKISTGRFNEAKEYLDLSLEMCSTFLSKYDHQIYWSLNEKLEFGVSLKEYMEKIYRLYYQLDIVLKDKKAELQHFKLAAAWSDSVSNEQAWKKVAMIQANYEMEISKSQISTLEKENEVQNLTLRKSKMYLFGLSALVLLVILGAIVYIRQRKIRAQYTLELERVKSEKLKELDHLKSQFFANISHEFRTPLTLIMGPLEKLLSKAEDSNDKKDLGIAKKYARNLQNLINNLLSISKLESGKMLLQASEIDIVKFVSIYIQSFESLAKQKNIELQFTAENKEIKAFIDREKFEQILNNLLSNAFKFTNDGGRIEVTISSKSKIENRQSKIDNVLISISDNGCGIPPEHIDHIFDRFYQIEQEDNHYEGTGIGLALTKELVDLHHGDISVESKPEIGTTFTIVLPLGKEHLKPEEIIDTDEPAKLVRSVDSFEHVDQFTEMGIHETLSADDAEKEDSKPLLLVVEDNDDLRSYILSYLTPDYRITQAVDGEMGLDKATEQIPDLVISDVMMPKMDGYKLCQNLKTDERTSHIPIILLTARASMESKIEGLETGADDFITKPFEPQELLARIKNLIIQRKLLHERFTKNIQEMGIDQLVKFDTPDLTSMDQSFLLKVTEYIIQNISNLEFNVEMLGDKMALSSRQLQRKLIGITGHSPNMFIRSVRLNRAAELLRNKAGNVTEIAYDVGFNNLSWFAKSFKEQFGVLPSEYPSEKSK